MLNSEQKGAVMKNITFNKKIFGFKIIITCVGLACCQPQIASAQATLLQNNSQSTVPPITRSVAIANYEMPAAQTLRAIILLPILQINTTIASAINTMTNALIKTTADLVFAFDYQIPFVMVTNNNLKTASESFTTNVDNALIAKVNEIFNVRTSDSSDSDSGNKNNIIINPPFAADDVPVGEPPTNASFWSKVISKANNIALPNSAQITKGNALFNINSILAANNCSDEQQQTFNISLKYIDPLNSLSIIRPGYSFYITYSPDANNKKGTKITTDESNDKQNFAALKLLLTSDETYRKYKYTYRSLLIARNIYLNIFYDALFRRVPKDNDSKSIAQLEDEQIDNYSKDSYYRELSKAPVGALLRENIIVQTKLLAEIHNMRKDLEKQRILEAVADLQTLNLNSNLLIQQTMEIEKKIYKWKFPNSQDNTNVSSTGGVPAGMPDVTGSTTTGTK
jgi:hypothetical protein